MLHYASITKKVTMATKRIQIAKQKMNAVDK